MSQREQFRRISGYIAIGLFVLVGILLLNAYFIFEDLEDKTKPMAENKFRTNPWFDGDIVIKNNMYRGYTIPNDELVYELTYTGKTVHEIIIEPKLEVLVAGESKLEEEIQGFDLGPFETKETKFVFHLTEIGENQVRYWVNVKNSTTNESKYESYTTINLDVNSNLDKIQEESNEINRQALIVSASIGIITATALLINVWFSNREINSLETHNSLLTEQNTTMREHTENLREQLTVLREQNEFIRDQSEFDNRPWIGPTSGLKRHPNIQNRVLFHYKNYGKSPAFNVKENGGCALTQPTKTDVKNMRSLDTETILVPQQEVQFGFNIPSEMVESFQNRETEQYYWILIRYRTRNENTEYGVIYKFNHNTNSFDVKEEWTEFEN